jgi:thymidylate synthase
MNNLDKQYTDLLQDILDNGITKKTRNGGTLSVFGRQIRHKMSDGFPLLTTKKMPFKTITTELLWFLRGDTNIKFLVDNNCHIWDGDAYKNYTQTNVVKNDDGSETHISPAGHYNQMTKEEFINKIKTDAEFAKKWGDLGPIYGKQWRDWHVTNKVDEITNEYFLGNFSIDQITNSINLLKTDPDSRRNRVSAWNVGELDQMTLPPCHTDFQFYTRELSDRERWNLYCKTCNDLKTESIIGSTNKDQMNQYYEKYNIPTRAISLMWNQRSVDTFLGLPFNIASYGLLLEIIAKSVNMVPDELIGNLGDTHLYLNHIEQAKEQIGRELSLEERYDLMPSITGHSEMNIEERKKINNFVLDDGTSYHKEWLDSFNIPTRTRQPFPLPTLNINTEFWPYEGGECGEGPLDAIAIFKGFTDEHFCKCLLEEDIQLSNYQSHPHIKAPLSN